ncbi:hypothetical protein HNQ36_001076 [Afipia massiliensis]|uniref:Uncharacterized protein n=1 Tax=Afipia massiliensis TaxID=211460 RepID=A0A840MWN4_9BRAD|nr:hypothetical protein [Afipia massiliensis]MBB5051122.1 hypothetical protein [Afipia massiliensis]
MTVLSAAQSAGIRLLGVKPTTLFSTSDAFAMELADLATEVATDIAEQYDWRQLHELAQFTGDGAAIAFNLPSNYDRMLKKAEVHSKDWQTSNFRRVRDLDEWIYIQQTAISGTPGNWIILGGKFQSFPPLPIAEMAKFYYIRKAIVTGTGTGGASKPAFTDDSDTFDLSERLLTLGLIWRWRSQKRMEYAEDLKNYELALEKAIAKDKGSNILTVGTQRVPSSSTLAYPGVLVR